MKTTLVALLIAACFADLAHASDLSAVGSAKTDTPAGLSVCCHDAVRWVRMNRPDPKHPEAPLVRSTDKQGQPLPEVIEPLVLYFSLDRATGKVLKGFAATEVRPKKHEKQFSSERVQTVDVQGLTWRDGRLSGKLAVTVGPQRFAWGQLYPAICTLDLDVVPGSDGTYQGRYGDYEVKGKTTCATTATPDLGRPCETTLYLHDAVSYRNMGGGGASCGGFAASWKDGKITACDLGDCYGYNIWNMAIVDASGLTLRDGKLSGVLVGKQTSTYNPGQVGDIRWTIEAEVIGDRVLGTGRAVKTPPPEHKRPAFEYDIAINGLIANTADLPDIKAWRLDHEIRARQEAGDESYWRGRNPGKPKAPSDTPVKKAAQP